MFFNSNYTEEDFMKRIALLIVLSITAFSSHAFAGTETRCMGNMCIVYAWEPVFDYAGNISGYVQVEISRYMREYAVID